jgi:hypothetical protein
MTNLQERELLKAVREIWDRTGRPIDADTIGQAAGFDDETTQRLLRTLDAKGYFGTALRGDDRIQAVTAPADID